MHIVFFWGRPKLWFVVFSFPPSVKEASLKRNTMCSPGEVKIDTKNQFIFVSILTKCSILHLIPIQSCWRLVEAVVIYCRFKPIQLLFNRHATDILSGKPTFYDSNKTICSSCILIRRVLWEFLTKLILWCIHWSESKAPLCFLAEPQVVPGLRWLCVTWCKPRHNISFEIACTPGEYCESSQDTLWVAWVPQ